MAKKIMIQGTMSNVGKSFITTGLCRIFRQDGLRVAPFKSQNMALNSFVTPDGLEIGRAQAVQAEACGIRPSADMNPILLKPSSDIGSQVVLHGVPIGDMSAREYFSRKKSLIPEIMESFRRLDEAYDVIVIEGAGSPAEINLKQDDIVNMGLAKLVDAPVLLTGDIDRGGVFAQLYGTVMLLAPDERARIGGLIINQFRGDVSLLTPGIGQIEELLHIPVLGVVPHSAADIDDEDSLSERLHTRHGEGALKIAVVRLPHLSNYTDFAPLEAEEQVDLFYTQRPEEISGADVIILPGSKNTPLDLAWLMERGLDACLQKSASQGTWVCGICGGYQMLGETMLTEDGDEMRGLCLLPVRTTFRKDKVTRQVQGSILASDGLFAGIEGCGATGYEIHMGQTTLAKEASPFARLRMTDAAQPQDLQMEFFQVEGITERSADTFVEFPHPALAKAIRQNLSRCVDDTFDDIFYTVFTHRHTDCFQLFGNSFRIQTIAVDKHVDICLQRVG